MSDKLNIRSVVSDLLSSTGMFGEADTIPEIIYEGMVVDVILDHFHPKYAEDGYNAGAIKVRIFQVNQGLIDDKLPWANPMDSTIQEYPLKGELVTIFRVRNAFFYTRKVAIAHRIQENGFLNLNNQLKNRYAKTLKNLIKQNVELSVDKHKFGDYYKPDSRVRPLKHFEGDVIIQGRMGQSIRFGSSAIQPNSPGLAPNIILRAGQAKNFETTRCTADSVHGLTLEDINNDASSIWMVSDQALPFEPITKLASSFNRSFTNTPQLWDKASITINSSRIVLNAKHTHIAMYSNEKIYLNSIDGVSIDTDDSVFITANKDVTLKATRNINFLADETISVTAGGDISLISLGKFSFTSKKIHLGGIQNDVEPIVGGTSLSIFLARFILALLGAGAVSPQVIYQAIGSPVPTTVVPPPIPALATFSHVLTPMGPGVLNPAIIAGLTTLFSELIVPNPGSIKALPFSGAPFNSYDAFVGMSNEDAILGVELNDFNRKSSKRIKMENNSWDLNKEYYRIV
jgi:hypothetical protein